jgi:hypothetical protein
VGALGLGFPDPVGERRLGQIQLAGDSADRLPFVEDQPNGPRFELVSELPALTAGRLRIGHAGHRIHLSEDVHEIGSGPG